MKLDCKITEVLKSDFNTLWRFVQQGNTLEVSTPYLMPDSTLFTLFLTDRQNRYIACDGGRIWELLHEHCDLTKDQLLLLLRELAKEYGLKEGSNQGVPLFYKDCRDAKLISSISFDVANFAIVATNVVLATGGLDEDEVAKEKRFDTQANNFLRGLLRSDQTLIPRHELPGVPNVNFSAVIQSTSRYWVVAYISGSDPALFRKNASDAALSFREAWSSSSSALINSTIPLLNNGAKGYQPDRLKSRLVELGAEAGQQPVLWSEKSELADLIKSDRRQRPALA